MKMKDATHILTALALVALLASAAGATPFPVSGGSYTANVVQRRDAAGTFLGVLTPTLTGCGDQFPPSADNVADGGHSDWALVGLGVGDSALMRIELDKTYQLNKIVTMFGDFRPDEHEIRVSPDGSSWTTVRARSSASGATYTDTFTAQDVRYIEWEVFGPGADLGGGPSYAYMKELMAFVASTASSPPQKEEGYNVAPTGTMTDLGGWVSWAGPAALTDQNPSTYAIRETEGVPAMALLDLGDESLLAHMRLGFAYGQNWAGGGKFEVSPDMSSWTTILDTHSALGNSSYSFAPTSARYLRITNYGIGGGALSEVMLFATEAEAPIPEPATMLLVATGALAIARRRLA